MGFSVRVLPEHRLAVVRLGDYVEGFGLVRALEALYRTPGFRPGFSTVWDARDIRVLDLLPAHIAMVEAALARIPSRFGTGRTAVVGRGETDDITARLLTLRYRKARRPRVRIATGAADAAAWLGVPPDVL